LRPAGSPYLVELVSGPRIEIFAHFAAPNDQSPLINRQLANEGFCVACRFASLVAGIAAGMITLSIVEHLSRSLLTTVGPSIAPEMNYLRRCVPVLLARTT
jgi:hypothetical protein